MANWPVAGNLEVTGTSSFTGDVTFAGAAIFNGDYNARNIRARRRYYFGDAGDVAHYIDYDSTFPLVPPNFVGDFTYNGDPFEVRLTFTLPLQRLVNTIFILSANGTPRDGYLLGSDWNTFNNKQDALSGLTSVALSGPSTWAQNSLTFLGGSSLTDNASGSLTINAVSAGTLTLGGTGATNTVAIAQKASSTLTLGVASSTLSARGTTPLLTVSGAGGLVKATYDVSLPLASAVSGSTGGGLTRTQYDAFNAKENALTFTAPLARATNTISLSDVSYPSSVWTFTPQSGKPVTFRNASIGNQTIFNFGNSAGSCNVVGVPALSSGAFCLNSDSGVAGNIVFNLGCGSSTTADTYARGISIWPFGATLGKGNRIQLIAGATAVAAGNPGTTSGTGGAVVFQADTDGVWVGGASVTGGGPAAATNLSTFIGSADTAQNNTSTVNIGRGGTTGGASNTATVNIGESGSTLSMRTTTPLLTVSGSGGLVKSSYDVSLPLASAGGAAGGLTFGEYTALSAKQAALSGLTTVALSGPSTWAQNSLTFLGGSSIVDNASGNQTHTGTTGLTATATTGTIALKQASTTIFSSTGSSVSVGATSLPTSMVGTSIALTSATTTIALSAGTNMTLAATSGTIDVGTGASDAVNIRTVKPILTCTAPLVKTNYDIAMPAATTVVNGYMTASAYDAAVNPPVRCKTVLSMYCLVTGLSIADGATATIDSTVDTLSSITHNEITSTYYTSLGLVYSTTTGTFNGKSTSLPAASWVRPVVTGYINVRGFSATPTQQACNVFNNNFASSAMTSCSATERQNGSSSSASSTMTNIGDVLVSTAISAYPNFRFSYKNNTTVPTTVVTNLQVYVFRVIEGMEG